MTMDLGKSQHNIGRAFYAGVAVLCGMLFFPGCFLVVERNAADQPVDFSGATAQADDDDDDDDDDDPGGDALVVDDDPEEDPPSRRATKRSL